MRIGKPGLKPFAFVAILLMPIAGASFVAKIIESAAKEEAAMGNPE
jgi:hypothetical protein